MRHWTALCVAALAAAGTVFGARAQPAEHSPPQVRATRLPERADRIVDYRIGVKLDHAARQLHGQQRLIWRNPSSDTITDLWFHLYLNAFKDAKSTFHRESGGQLRGLTQGARNWGWIEVTSLKLEDGTDLTSRMRFEHPDDDNTDDRTVMRVPLSAPVPGGGTVTLDFVFTAQLPEVYARTGYAGDFYLIGQWFPKIAVYEPAGRRGRRTGGWNSHQFHANSEFYADFGRFTVEMTVPAPFVVGATGRRTAERKNADGTATYTYEQADVHDFAWTADPRFVVVRETFSAAREVSPAEQERTATLLDRPVGEVALSDVEITLLMQPAHLPQAARHMRAVKTALKDFGLWYGRYPYPTLTVVDPPEDGEGAGGMEYPTFFTGGTSRMLNYWPFNDVLLPEQVVVHEFGHQFWYGLVASNEFEEAWLDEGINSYSTSRVVDRNYGADRSAAKLFGLRVGELEIVHALNLPTPRPGRVRQNSWTYMNTDSYGFYSYMKPELVLGTLEGLLGEQTMSRIMRTYHERWRFGHPSSDDFYAVANEVSGQDLTTFFKQTIESNEVLDYEVSSIAAVDLDGGQYDNSVVVRRTGGVTVPIEIAVKFEGLPPERVAWDGRDEWKRLSFTREQRIEWAQVDPDRKVRLDVNWINNARRLAPDRRVATKWTARWLFWLQNVLRVVGV
ncbi:MAG TPA: M1 family metallopeptidase [Vicinamibacterales bacterium]